MPDLFLWRKHWIVAGLVVLYLWMAVPTLTNVGITVDEPVYMTASKMYGFYYYRILQGANPLDPELIDLWRANNEHPPLVKTLSFITWGISLLVNQGHLNFMVSVASHRFLTVLFAACGILIVYVFASELINARAALFSAFTLIFLPRFFAHSRYITLDVPLAVMWLLTVWSFWKALSDWRYGILTGFLFGFCLSTKINGFIALFPIVLWLLIVYQYEVGSSFSSTSTLIKKHPRRFWSLLISLSVLSPIVFVLLWPWFWRNPIPHFLELLEYHWSHATFPVYYFGKTYLDGSPWHYPWVMLGITVPLPILFFASIGTVKSVLDMSSFKHRGTLLIILNALVPVLFVMLASAGYDGTRLLMPSFPFIAILVGAGAELLNERIENGSFSTTVSRIVTLILLLLIVLPGGITHLQQGPYENVYFNSLIGGQKGALRAGMELDYWGQSYIEALPWLNQKIAQNSNLKVHIPFLGGCSFLRIYRDGDIGFLRTKRIPPWVQSQSGLLHENIKCGQNYEDSKYIMFMTRHGYFQKQEWQLYREREPVFSFSIDGVNLNQIYEGGASTLAGDRNTSTPKPTL